MSDDQQDPIVTAALALSAMAQAAAYTTDPYDRVLILLQVMIDGAALINQLTTSNDDGNDTERS